MKSFFILSLFIGINLLTYKIGYKVSKIDSEVALLQAQKLDIYEMAACILIIREGRKK